MFEDFLFNIQIYSFNSEHNFHTSMLDSQVYHISNVSFKIHVENVYT